VTDGYAVGVGGADFDFPGNELHFLIEYVAWVHTGAMIGTGWHHIVVTMFGASLIRAYIDGVQVHTSSGFGTAWTPTTRTQLAGYNGTRILSAGNLLDEVRIYDITLTPEQVTAHYNAGNGLYDGDLTNLAAGYHLDESEGGGEPEVVEVNRDSPVTRASCTAAWFVDAHAQARAFQGRRFELYQEPKGYEGEAVYVDEGKDIRFVLFNGKAQFWAGEQLIWCIRHDLDGSGAHEGLYTTFDLHDGGTDWGEGAAAPIEVGTWTVEQKTIYVNVAYRHEATGVQWYRLVEIDLTAKKITCAALKQGALAASSLAGDPAWGMWGATVFQVWNRSQEEFRTGASVKWNGEIWMSLDWKQEATDGECE
jgi:hypothetical protein